MFKKSYLTTYLLTSAALASATNKEDNLWPETQGQNRSAFIMCI